MRFLQGSGGPMFELGFSTLGCPNYGIDQVIELATDNRYSGVEIRFLRWGCRPADAAGAFADRHP